ncbi:MAG: ribosomal subunit interface protein [Candidatus Marinimicrobia bacterium]|mgnify:CR=1 FL=1|nr:ribosomal subunit interface protein [Candidatus Neomarinimicrobiota bacterium]|tara:strand:- start:35 stop:325 length:291 start_codon:yes stop_codon:yes gene_type:complete
MNIEFTARHFNAPNNLRDYAEKEVSRILKYHSRAVQCQIILIQENNQFTTELNLSIPQRKLNVKDTTDNVRKSIDSAVRKMIKRVSKIKIKQRPVG